MSHVVSNFFCSNVKGFTITFDKLKASLLNSIINVLKKKSDKIIKYRRFRCKSNRTATWSINYYYIQKISNRAQLQIMKFLCICLFQNLMWCFTNILLLSFAHPHSQPQTAIKPVLFICHLKFFCDVLFFSPFGWLTGLRAFQLKPNGKEAWRLFAPLRCLIMWLLSVIQSFGSHWSLILCL